MDHMNNWHLQLFADGGDGAGAATGADGAAASDTGVNAPAAGEATGIRKTGKTARKQPLNVDYGVAPAQEQTEEPPTAEPQEPQQAQKEESFEELIKGKYKKDFDERVQGVISKRFKAANQDKARLETVEGLLSTVAAKYGLSAEDLQGDGLQKLAKELEQDDIYLSDEANSRGMSVTALRQIKRMEAENARVKREEAQRQQDQQNRERFDRLMQQAEQAKRFYPGFDINTELQNPDFVRLTANNVDAKTAYEVIHKDEIMRGGMAHAAQTAAQKVSNAVQSNAARPTENGVTSTAPAKVRVSDPRMLTKEQRADLKERVRRGEKVAW